MARSFRFGPPEPRSDLLSRPRLLRSLAARWHHRVTALTGGPGLGKTTLLAQAIAENRLAPRGEDVWVGVEPQDADADRLSRVVAAALAARDGAGGTGPGRGGSGPGGNGGPAGARVPPASAVDGLWPAPRRGDGDRPLATALDGHVAPDPAAIADAVWHRAPSEACLVLDDVHLLPPRSTGAAWLGALLDALPANGHVVLAGRSDPPVPLRRFGAPGSVLWLDEDELRFSEEELTGFASQRGLDPHRFERTGGWPAMAELAASVDRDVTGDYLWEVVLEPLGTVRRHILAVLCDLGGADDGLLTAAVGAPVELATALAGVPLVERGPDGWYRPHGLWRTAPRLALSPGERAEVRRRAADHLSRRGRFDEAFRLLQEADLWDAAPRVLRTACLASDRLVSPQLGRWLSASPDAVRGTTAGRLAAGLHTAFTAPAGAVEPLEDAVRRCRQDGDDDAELVAIAQLGRLAWWRQDLAAMAPLIGRVAELEAAGNATARALASVCRAILADIRADNDGVLAELAGLDAHLLDPAWELLAAWLYGSVHVELGEPEAAHEVVRRLLPTADLSLRTVLLALDNVASWSEGRVDEVLERIPPAVEAGRATGLRYNISYGLTMAGAIYAHVGDLPAARRHLDEALALAPPAPGGQPTVVEGLVRTLLAFGEGDEAAAADALGALLQVHPIDRGVDRRMWRQTLSVTYTLRPEAREYWEGVPLKGFLALERDLAAAVHHARTGDLGRVRTLELPDLGLVRAALHVRLAAELAVALAEVGRPEGRLLLDALGTPGRAAVRALATGTGTRPSGAAGSSGSGSSAGAAGPAATTRETGTGPGRKPRSAGSATIAKSAKALLAAVPAPPPQVTWLGVLGPLELRRGGRGEAAGDVRAVGPEGEVELRRRRVQELLAYLVGHRRAARSAVMAALWPDLDDKAAANNLGVTVHHLQRLLEPGRDPGEPPYLVRMDGLSVQLVTGDFLKIDLDEFDAHLAAAARAEADGTPSLALTHDLAAVELYRGDLHVDLPAADWLMLDREHCRSRFVGAAVRAGQLLLGRGDVEQADAVALRALEVDPFCEEAYAVLVGGALARRDRSTATRLLARCHEALADLGVAPSAATLELERRLQAPAP
ncbi:MAG TPA: BTAD domain-containing putative transcriptional regulator [Acidimicrobiales bacterium]